MTNVKRFRDCGVCLSRVDCMVGVHNSNLQRNPGAVQSQVGSGDPGQVTQCCTINVHGSGDPGQVTQCCTINVQFLRKFDEVFFCQEYHCYSGGWRPHQDTTTGGAHICEQIMDAGVEQSWPRGWGIQLAHCWSAALQ